MQGKPILSFADVEMQVAQLHGRISKERDNLLGHIGNLQGQINSLIGCPSLPLKEKEIPWREKALKEFNWLWDKHGMTRSIFYEKTRWESNLILSVLKGALGGGRDSLSRKPRRLTDKHAFAIDLAFGLSGSDSFKKYVGLE